MSGRVLHRSTRLVYHTLADYISREGWAPTCRELCQLTGLASTSTVHAHLERLAEEGFIELGGSPRAIRLTVRRMGMVAADSRPAHEEWCRQVTHEYRSCDCGADR